MFAMGSTDNPKMKPKKTPADFAKRFIFTILLIGIAVSILYSGPIVIMLAILILQVKCFNEIINIGYTVNKCEKLPNFRLMNWYFLIAANFFFYGENLAAHFDVFMGKYYLLQFIISYHRFVTFCMYLSGIVWFVCSIIGRYRLRQYRILAWTHILLKIVVLQSHMIIENMFSGIIWTVLPIFLVVANDIFAYIFGILIGSRPLIKLSPKKTWEGFIGGGISTLIFAAIAGSYMCQFDYFVCPLEYVDTDQGIKMITNCDYKNKNFQKDIYSFETSLFKVTFEIYPFILHSLALSLFASIIAPFGGFFASGFKRALKMKDFSNSIPGHGGFMDRFDCQFLMGTFVNVYIFTFFKTYKVEKIFNNILRLDTKGQVGIYLQLEQALKTNNML